MLGRIKIAIADDHSRVREALKIQLERFGFEVIIMAGNGEDLISQIINGKENPDLVVLDANMPIMNGWDTAYVLKSKWSSIKVIGYSLDDNNREPMLKMGADAFLLKDCTGEELYKTITDCLNVK